METTNTFLYNVHAGTIDSHAVLSLPGNLSFGVSLDVKRLPNDRDVVMASLGIFYSARVAE